MIMEWPRHQNTASWVEIKIHVPDILSWPPPLDYHLHTDMVEITIEINRRSITTKQKKIVLHSCQNICDFALFYDTSLDIIFELTRVNTDDSVCGSSTFFGINSTSSINSCEMIFLTSLPGIGERSVPRMESPDVRLERFLKEKCSYSASFRPQTFVNC